MPGKKFCTQCGALVSPAVKVCTQCGFRFPVDPSPNPAVPLPGTAPPGNRGNDPDSLPGFLGAIITGMIRTGRQMVPGIITGIILSFLIVLIIQVFLIPAGFGGVQAGPGSAESLLFWFIFMAVIAFFVAQTRSRGIRKTLAGFLALPSWMGGSFRRAGLAILPLFTAGVAVALAARMVIPGTLALIPFLMFTLGVLVVRQQSLTIRAMQLAFSDLNGTLKQPGAVLPAPGFAVTMVTGSAAGFLLAIVIKDTTLFLAAAVVLAIAGTILVILRNRRSSAGGTAVLLVLWPSGGKRP